MTVTEVERGKPVNENGPEPSSAPATDDDMLGLHDLRLRGVRPAADVPELATRLEARGFATRRGAKVVPTAAGRDADTAWSREAPGSPGAEAADRAYAVFLPLNRELLRLCHDWQMRGGSANLHDDPTYDWAVIDRLRDLDERVGPVVRRVARAVDRFAPYRPALREARRRVEAGEPDWFASPRCDSYHTVWMRLHEDLLLATGAARQDEPPVE